MKRWIVAMLALVLSGAAWAGDGDDKIVKLRD